MSIWRNVINLIKYIKIFLVHPATEITLSIIYLTSFFYIGFILFSKKKYNDLEILNMTESYLFFNNFNMIKTPTQFKGYLEEILEKIYTINPQTEEIPLFISISPIRFIPFSNSNECNEKIDYTKNCNVNTNKFKFKCVIDYLSKSFNLQCGKAYSDGKNFLQNKLTGHYSSYNIRNADSYIDFTRDSYYSTYENKIIEMIENKQLKAIIMQINLIAPSNGNYIDVILGIEMTNYFTDVKTIFSAYIFNDQRPKTNIILLILIILLSISIIVSLLKFIYEINVKCIWTVHIFQFLIEALDTVFVIIGIIYIIEDKNLEFKVNLEKFESHLKYINIIWFVKLFFSILVIFSPFRFLSLFSWWKSVSEPFVIVLNVLFRMFPGLIITLILFLLTIIMFFFINYFLFNDIFEFYETMFNSFISAFNIEMIANIYERKKPSKLFGNLFQSKYSAVFVFFQALFFYFYISIVIATVVYLYKKAVISFEPPQKNKYVKKLEQIQEKLEEQKQLENNNDVLLQKQILWLSLDKKNFNDNYLISKHQVLLFKSSIEIISYLKYIFAIKPEIQFKKLIYKLNIIIEISQKKVGEKEIRQISNLAEWLIFVGSKIPIIIYSNFNLENNLKMKLHNLYKLFYFVNDDKFLEKIIESKADKNLSISENINFSFTSMNNKQN